MLSLNQTIPIRRKIEEEKINSLDLTFICRSCGGERNDIRNRDLATPHVHHHSWISHHCTAHSQMQSTSQKTYIAIVGKTHTPNLIVRHTRTHTCRKRNDPFRAVAKDLWWWQAWAAAILFHQSTKIRYKNLFSHCLSDSISFNLFISTQFRSSFQLPAPPIKHQFYPCSKMTY